MALHLAWRDAERGDRPALQQFSCTVPAPRRDDGRALLHPKSWEREVQVGIHLLTPPVADGVLLLGEDSQGLAAVALAHFGVEHDPCLVKLRALAVEQRWRGQGGGVADEAMVQVLTAAARHGDKSGCDVVRVLAWVHPSNGPSQRMCERAGFRHWDDSSGHQEWVLELG